MTGKPITTPIPAMSGNLRERWNGIADTASNLVGHDLLALVNRVSIAAIFYLSGRTKVDGLLTVNQGAIGLFRDEYRLPVIPPELAAHLAAYAEHFFPLLLVFGLFTRFSAVALLGMTAVIQCLVYPDAWPTHLSWAGLLLYLAGRGGGVVSLDHLLKLK
jgi:putative oxidoreductase